MGRHVGRREYPPSRALSYPPPDTAIKKQARLKNKKTSESGAEEDLREGEVGLLLLRERGRESFEK